MRTVCALMLVGLGALAWAGAASARMQARMYCWEPDAELPVSCDEDPPGDDGGELSGRRAGSAGPLKPGLVLGRPLLLPLGV